MSEVTRAEEYFRQLLESAPDAIVGVDREGRIVLVNIQTERTFGHSRAALLHQPIEILLPDRLRRVHQRHRSGYYSDPRTRPMGLRLDLAGRRKDGTEFPAEISLSPLGTGEGMLVTSVIRDLTDRKRAEEERLRLVRERTEAEIDNRTKDEFLATISHELRTPRQAILGWIRMLRAGSLEESVASRALETIERNARIQARLVDDLLDVSRDDEPDTLEEVAVFLREPGARVSAARSASDALSAFSGDAPNLFVSDLAMPGEDGLALIRKVRALLTRRKGGTGLGLAIVRANRRGAQRADLRGEPDRGGAELAVRLPLEAG